MSEQAPKGAYVYQPHPVSKADGLLWAVSGVPNALTRAQATEIARVVNEVLTWDVTCEHGVAMDVHCCGCHSGFLFDSRKCTCF